MPPKNVPIPASQKIFLIVLGLLLSVILLELGLRTGGFILSSIQERRNQASLRIKDSYRILCLGESTTALGGEHSYPSQLERILNERDAGQRFSVINEGVVGVETDAILARLAHNLDKYKPDMVITMIGVNDDDDNNDDDTLHMPAGEDGASPAESISFYKTWRVYKLAQFLRFHMAEKNKKLQALYGAGLQDDKSLTTLGILYRGERRFDEAEKIFKKAIALNPQNLKAYKAWAELYSVYQDLPDKAEMVHKKAIENNPDNAQAYYNFYSYYWLEGRYDRDGAAVMLQKAVELAPENAQYKAELAVLYAEMGLYERAEEAIAQIPEPEDRYEAYIDVGGSLEEAEKMFRKALAVAPGHPEAYIALGEYYLFRENLAEAERLFQKGIEMDPSEDEWLGQLAVLYEVQQNSGRAEEYFKKAAEVRSRYVDPATIRNYASIVRTIKERGIPLICMQYPMRSISDLMSMVAPQRGIWFVDNERNFKQAVKQGGYKEYFTDMFAGEFGHCTAEGNRLIAQNVADTVWPIVQ